MLIFFADGRLGNQIFKYAFLKNIAKKDETLIIYNFDSIIDVFDLSRRKTLIIKKRRYLRAILKLIIRKNDESSSFFLCLTCCNTI